MKIYKLMILTALISILALSGCAADISEADEIRLTSVETGTPQMMSISDSVRLIGKFEVAQRIEVMTGGSGDITDIYVKTGDEVKQGQKLFRLDNEDQRLSYSITESQLRTVKDNLFTQLNDAIANYNKKNELFLSGSISKSELDVAKTQVSLLQNQYDDALTTYKNQVKSLSKVVADRTIVSPISGTVGKISIEKNETVGNVSALEVINDENMLLKVKATGETLDNIIIGSKAVIFIDGDMKKALDGEVIEYNEIADINSGLYDMVIAISDISNAESYGATLRSGMYAEAKIEYNEREGTLIPNSSVIRQGDKKYVFVLIGDKVKKTEVLTGGLVGDLIEVSSGITASDIVVTSGQSYLADEDTVRVVNN